MAIIANDNHSGFRVIIAGGGIAGLTLASALEKANIDFILLEAHLDIAPQVGASIGTLVNGQRILDQLGCLDDIFAEMAPLLWLGDHYENGDYIYPLSDLFQLDEKRNGYPATFVDRQVVLKALSDNIVQKEKILLGKRISKVVHADSGITVYCTDGSSYYGDLLAGADGVNSITRKEMWRLANEAEPGLITEKEQTSMSAEYQGLYGISKETHGLPPNSLHVTYTKDMSSMIIIGKDNRVYYFIYRKLDRVYHVGEIPRFSKADAEAYALANSDLNIMPGGSVKFGDIWRNRQSYTLVAVEEARYDHWTWGRIACIGDSIHKMTPNAGQGGGQSIESAAALANAVKAMTLEAATEHPTKPIVVKWLRRFQQSRQARTEAVMEGANALTRIQALKSFKERFVAYHLIPRLGDALADLTSELVIGAAKLDYLPPPARSMMGTRPFNPEQGVTKHESLVGRAMYALPFLAMFVFAQYAMDSASAGDRVLNIVQGFVEAGAITWESGSVPLQHSFYHISWFDDLWRPIPIIFSPSMYGWDPVSWWQMSTFLADFGILYTIMLIESVRRASNMTLIQLPVLFGCVFQVLGVGPFSSIYFFFHYIFTQIYTFHSTDRRLTDLSWTRSILISMLLIYYVPFFISYFGSSLTDRHLANWFWQPFPLWVWILQRLLRACGLAKDTVKRDRVQDPLRDLKWIKATLVSVATISAGMHVYTIACSPYGIMEIYLPTAWSTRPSQLADQSFTAIVREGLKWDELLMFVNIFLWLGYMFWDLKAAKMLRESWTMIVVKGLLVTIIAGPGVTLALGWWVREQTLVTRRHKGAIITGQNDGISLPMKKQLNSVKLEK